jgi:hypothetical protein
MGVEVTFEDTSNGTRTSTATDDSGSFELNDLPPGQYRVLAESLDGISEPASLQLVQGIESEVKLILKPSESIPFYVVSSRGPIAGAAVQVWIAPGVPRYFTRTDREGRFEVKLPPGTTEVGLTVEAQGYPLKLTRLQISRESDKSSDANTVTLDTSGATLMLDLEPPGRALDSSATAYLVHNGAVEAAGTLVGWSTEQGDTSHGQTLISAIEPGDYALCFLVRPAEVAALWWGALPSGSCRKGSVERGGTLTLSPP